MDSSSINAEIKQLKARITKLRSELLTIENQAVHLGYLSEMHKESHSKEWARRIVDSAHKALVWDNAMKTTFSEQDMFEKGEAFRKRKCSVTK